MNKEIAIHVNNLTVAYDENPVILQGNADIYANSLTAIIGPNGAGKSTLIKAMLQIIKPISGTVSIWGKDYKEVYKKIAYIPQSGNVNWNFPITVEEVVLMGRYVHVGVLKRYTRKDKEMARNALALVNMVEFAKRHISELSGGQKQRVFLARAMAQDADMYVLDEPLQGVDVKTEGIVMDILKQFQSMGKTILCVHHDLSTVEKYFDHVLMMNTKYFIGGKVKEVFTKENIERIYGA